MKKIFFLKKIKVYYTSLKSNFDKMMIKECNQLIRWKDIHMERAKMYSVKKKRLNVTI